MIKKKYILVALVIGLAFMLAAFCVILMLDEGEGGDGRPKLVFNSHSIEKTYDGTELVHHSYALTKGKLNKNAQVTPTFSGTRLNAGTSTNDFKVQITLNGKDISEDYNIEYRLGNLTVNPLPLAVLSGSAQKIYDGQPLQEETCEVVSGELVENHAISAGGFSSITDAGEIDNQFMLEILDGNINVTANYLIEKRLGELIVSKKGVTVRSGTAVATYDGKTLICHEYNHSEVLEGHEVRVEFLSELTDAGGVPNHFGTAIFDGETDITYNYEINYAPGDLIVQPRPLAIRSGSAKKVYDGKPLVCDEFEIVSSQPLENHKLKVIISGSQTEIGKSDNDIAEVTLWDVDTGRNVSHNYLVDNQEGQLIVFDTDGYLNQPTGDEIDTSGKIDGGLIENDNPVARVYSDLGSTIYLKKMSFGDYNGSFWGAANEYPLLIDGKYSFSYLSGIALKESGRVSHSVKITPLTADYLLPVYLENSEFGYEIQASDIENIGDTSAPYSLYFYDYNGYGFKNAINQQFEADYYRFVHENYLNLEQSTKSFFLSIITSQRFDFYDNDIIIKVAEYIKNSAVYNQDYPAALDNESNIAVKFLSEYRQGVCAHFASAAVLLYRALGIPARYTVGYFGQLKKEHSVYINTPHAYVEVYLKGFGWLMVEVTPTDFQNEPPQKEELAIKPIDLSMKYYGGAVLYPVNKVEGLEQFLAAGFSYSVTVSGRQATIGMGKSTIESFTLFNPQGLDVTAKYEITFLSGKLHMYAREITVRSLGGEKTYDGLPLTVSQFEFDEPLAVDHWAEAVFDGTQTVVGRSQNRFEIKIFDGAGEETVIYKIRYVYGDLRIIPRNITVIAGSSEKPYDGLPLTCNEFQIEGELADDDNIFVIISGSLTGVGIIQNYVISVIITAKDGTNVTNCYSITTENGELRVLAPEG